MTDGAHGNSADDSTLLKFIERKQQRKRRRFAVSILLLTAIVLTILSFLPKSSEPIHSPISHFVDRTDEEILSAVSKSGAVQFSAADLTRAITAAAKLGRPTDELIRRRVEVQERERKSNVMRNSLNTFSLIFVIAVAGGTALLLTVFYNQLSDRDEAVDGSWAQVQTVLQRRLDLIPKLVEAVKGYAKHEERVLTDVTELRGRLVDNLKSESARPSAGSVQNLSNLDNSLRAAEGRLFAVIEQYPELKADQNFLALQDQLEGTENRIAVERARYNETVKEFNRVLRRFPYNIVGAWFDFPPRAYFQAAIEANESPELGLK